MGTRIEDNGRGAVRFVKRLIKMFSKVIFLIGMTSLLGDKVLSQNRPNTLKCYECDPGDLNMSGKQMKCLTDDDDFGKLVQCNGFNDACAKGKVELNGNEFTIRRCHANKADEVGTCSEETLLEMKATL